MTIQQAKENIGQPFKVSAMSGGGALALFDIIRKVTDEGIVTGDFIEAYCEDCRFKGDQPSQLKGAKKRKQKP